MFINKTTFVVSGWFLCLKMVQSTMQFYPRIYLGMMVTVISSPCHSLLRLMYMVELATSASRPSSRVANLVTNH